MLTKSLPELYSQPAISPPHSPPRALRVREMLCGLRGHDLMLHFENGRRVYLRCARCGHETPGWQTW